MSVAIEFRHYLPIKATNSTFYRLACRGVHAAGRHHFRQPRVWARPSTYNVDHTHGPRPSFLTGHLTGQIIVCTGQRRIYVR